jgi:hypothetical protein
MAELTAPPMPYHVSRPVLSTPVKQHKHPDQAAAFPLLTAALPDFGRCLVPPAATAPDAALDESELSIAARPSTVVAAPDRLVAALPVRAPLPKETPTVPKLTERVSLARPLRRALPTRTEAQPLADDRASATSLTAVFRRLNAADPSREERAHPVSSLQSVFGLLDQT